MKVSFDTLDYSDVTFIIENKDVSVNRKTISLRSIYIQELMQNYDSSKVNLFLINFDIVNKDSTS